MTGKLKKSDHLYLVDGSSFIFRAYHALPPLNRKSDGLPVGAVAGFCTMLFKLIKEMKAAKRPSHLAVIFDAAAHTFRNDLYPDYKANRSETPEDLIPQFPLIRDAVKAFNVTGIEMKGFEADDLIATYAVAAAKAGARVSIVSTDKDMMQLVNDKIDMLDTMKNRWIGEAQVFEKFGVKPDKVIDVQALAGDSSDNVPGVPGIGIKTAALLINEFGDLDTLLARANEVPQTKRRENLIEFADQARLSRELVTLKQDVPIEYSADEMMLREPEAEVLFAFLAEMEFNTLARRMAGHLGIGAPGPLPAPPSVVTPQKSPGKSTAEQATAPALAAGAGPGPAAGPDTPINPDDYATISHLDELQSWADEAREQGFVAVDTETTSLDAMQAQLVGVSLALAPGRACYIPLAHGHDPERGFDLEGGETIEQIPFDDALRVLRDILQDPSILKIGQNLKYDTLLLSRYDIHMQAMDDTMLMSYALDAGLHGHGMDELSKKHLNHEPIPYKEIAGSGKKAITFDQVAIDRATRYAAEDADVTLRLWRVLKPRLMSEHMMTLYETLERPMITVLTEMERHGILVDRAVLARLSGDFAKAMAKQEKQIYTLAGEEFNIASPKQLGEILFDKMSLEGGAKTKTGAWSTSADVLEDLAAQGHDLPVRVLQWRHLAKLKSTYTDALPDYINPETKRVHTSYSLAGTTTGRLASSDPNLQNIPVRTKEGRMIRTAFVAEKGHQLLSADYSQIELRILAHMADIDVLQQAFAEGLDIHAMTASEIFGVPVTDMDPMVRRRAKAINFGIIYGISAFGLANQLGISRGQAADYIKTYFERFPGIKDYMEATKEQARRQGYVRTLFGRKCHLPEIDSKQPARRSFMERAAINAPIQGTAADIIRRAMIRMPQALKDAGLKAKMLLQVHDELIFEVPEAQLAKTIPVVTRIMERAPAPVVELAVPLVVDARAAGNWDEAH